MKEGVAEVLVAPCGSPRASPRTCVRARSSPSVSSATPTTTRSTSGSAGRSAGRSSPAATWRSLALISLAEIGGHRGQGEEPFSALGEIRSTLRGELVRGKKRVKPGRPSRSACSASSSAPRARPSTGTGRPRERHRAGKRVDDLGPSRSRPACGSIAPCPSSARRSSAPATRPPAATSPWASGCSRTRSRSRCSRRPSRRPGRACAADAHRPRAWPPREGQRGRRAAGVHEAGSRRVRGARRESHGAPAAEAEESSSRRSRLSGTAATSARSTNSAASPWTTTTSSRRRLARLPWSASGCWATAPAAVATGSHPGSQLSRPHGDHHR